MLATIPWGRNQTVLMRRRVLREPFLQLGDHLAGGGNRVAVRQPVARADVGVQTVHRDLEPGQAHFFPGNRPAGLGDQRAVRPHSLFQEERAADALAGVVSGVSDTGPGIGRHTAGAESEYQVTAERNASCGNCFGRCDDADGVAFGVRRT